MKKTNSCLLIFVCLLNSAFAQNDKSIKRFIHKIDYHFGYKTFNYHGEYAKNENFIGNFKVNDIAYILTKTTKSQKVQPFFGLGFNYGVSRAGKPFHTLANKLYYKYTFIKFGLEKNFNDKFSMRLSGRVPIIVWFDASILGGQSTLFPSYTQLNEPKTIERIKRLFVLEFDFSRKIMKNTFFQFGLRKYIVGVEGEGALLAARQSLIFQMGVSYTF